MSKLNPAILTEKFALQMASETQIDEDSPARSQSEQLYLGEQDDGRIEVQPVIYNRISPETTEINKPEVSASQKRATPLDLSPEENQPSRKRSEPQHDVPHHKRSSEAAGNSDPGHLKAARPSRPDHALKLVDDINDEGKVETIADHMMLEDYSLQNHPKHTEETLSYNDDVLVGKSLNLQDQRYHTLEPLPPVAEEHRRQKARELNSENVLNQVVRRK